MILVENILKKYNAIGINIPKFMIKWMRSNHAGETGAVWIYKGASCIFWNKKISKMSKEHILTETNHLIVMENLLTSNEKSKLLFLWRIMGFVLGFLSAMFGYKFFCITVDAVETFVEKHYNEQIEYLLNNNLNYKLAMVLKKCCDEEIEHQQDARSKVLEKDEGKFTNFWKKIVGSGSNMAVNVSKLV